MPGCTGILRLGSWHGIDCSSPLLVERTLQLLAFASQTVIERCVVTLKQTPRVLRCWAQSWGPSFCPYPLECPQAPSLRKYSRVWTSAVCYFFRLWDQSHRLKEATSDLSGIDFTAQQQAAMQKVWSLLQPLAICDQNHQVPSALPNDIIEATAHLFLTFWTETPKDVDLEKSAIARFSGVLGIHPDEYSFRRAYDYTPFLSALIWVGRVVFLEYALPLKPYESLTQRWPGREEYSDLVQRLRSVRSRYMERGSMSPLGYLIERRQHGRAIAKREGPSKTIGWSQDGHTLHIDDSSITVSQFRQVVHGVIAQTQHSLDELLFQWWPEINLDLKDDMSNRRPGYSFLADPENRLQSKFRLLSQRMFAQVGGLSWTNTSQLSQYLRKCDRSVQLLFSAIHTTSGMPARGQELRTIRWANTIAVPRNVVCFQGRLILIFPYNKACTSTNNSFYIVRSPSPAVERMLFVFLVYLRPMRDMIARKLLIREATTESNRHLFSKHDQFTSCFSSAGCLRSLQLATTYAPLTMTMRNYRQISVAMSKRHIPHLLKPFDPHTPNDLDGFLRLLSFQTGHKPATHAGAYALERAFPAKLQPDLIHRYMENSDVWQKFLMIGKDDYIEFEMPPTLLDEPPLCSDGTQSIHEMARFKTRPPSLPLHEIQNGAQRHMTQRTLKRKAEPPLSPTSRKIQALQRQLDELVAERESRVSNQSAIHVEMPLCAVTSEV